MSCSWVACPKRKYAEGNLCDANAYMCTEVAQKRKSTHISALGSDYMLILRSMHFKLGNRSGFWPLHTEHVHIGRGVCVCVREYVREKLRGKINAEKKTANNDFPLYTRSCVPQYLLPPLQSMADGCFRCATHCCGRHEMKIRKMSKSSCWRLTHTCTARGTTIDTAIRRANGVRVLTTHTHPVWIFFLFLFTYCHFADLCAASGLLWKPYRIQTSYGSFAAKRKPRKERSCLCSIWNWTDRMDVSVVVRMPMCAATIIGK